MPRGEVRHTVATADMWFDPVCPWTWLTSRWLLEVEQVRDVQVHFHVMSLELLDGDPVAAEPAAIDPSREKYWGPVRVAMATDLSLGPEALSALYAALGQLIHQERAPIDRDLYARALHRAGLPHSLANAAMSPYYDDAIRASHDAGWKPVGGAIGCPVIHYGGVGGEMSAFFGPVVSPSPRGEAAGRLWDGIAIAAGTEGFFELKRIRTRSPIFD
jgi:hypothetical protein